MDKKTDVLRSNSQYDIVRKYYGEVVQKTSHLKTDACCTAEALPAHIKRVLPLIEDEIKSKYYGCGSPIPLCIEGLKILDLGCGTGRDCYVMSKLVGPKGFVYGIDMTDNQIAIARKYIETQTEAFGYSRPNVKFIFDYIENIPKHFEKESLDVVTSNCVINLTEDKEVVFENVYQVLKFGGEMDFSDVYADRRVPKEMSKDPVLLGECLGGALYYKDFERIARKVGFSDPRIVSKRTIEIDNKEIQKLVGNIKFYSITYRLWKLKGLEDACEAYGHIAVYNEQISESPFEFELDDRHVFYRNKPERVCGNTALMLSCTRFRKYFQIMGSFKEHFGAFKDCFTAERNSETDSSNSGCC
ncbi:MAG: methyltransferase domain-containing protein [Planctomycetota bacterium]|jgi:ubiquinone/menaquinone biosynthesis C-methylase UbiE